MVRQRAGPNAARNGEDCMNHRGHRLAAALLALAIALPAGAAETVKIGVIYPLSGNAASAGNSAKDAIELGAEIVNGVYPELKGSTLAGAAGLANLGGAKVELLNGDHQGNPAVGQSQTLRLVTQEKVAAMLGAYHSSVALTATAVAERYGVPFLVADSVALNITQRGFKWIFRSGPIAPDFAKAYTSFLGELKQAGRKVDAIAIVNENTDYGTSVAASISDAANKSGIKVAAQIPYNANGSDVSGQVLQLKQLAPDAVIFISYPADDHRRRCRLLRPGVHSGGRRDRPGRDEPQRLGSRQARRQQLHGQRAVQEEVRPRSRRHQRPLDAGILGAGRRHQSRRLDRSRKDPEGAAGHRSQARAAHDRLSRREIRRDRPEHAVRHLFDPAPGQGIQVGVAARPRDRQARLADDRLEDQESVIKSR